MRRPPEFDPAFDPAEEDYWQQLLENLESVLISEKLQILAHEGGYVITSTDLHSKEFSEIWDLSNHDSAGVLQKFIDSLPPDWFLLIACDVIIRGKITIEGHRQVTFGGYVLVQDQADIRQCYLEDTREDRRRNGRQVSIRNSGKIQDCSITSGSLTVDYGGQVVNCWIACDTIRIVQDTKRSVWQRFTAKLSEKPAPLAVIHNCNIKVRDLFEIGSSATVKDCEINIGSKPNKKAEITVYDRAVVDGCTINAANAKINVWGTIQKCTVLAAAELHLQFGSSVVNSACHSHKTVIASVVNNCGFSGDRATFITGDVSRCNMYFSEFEAKPGMGSLHNCKIMGNTVKIAKTADNCIFIAPSDGNMIIVVSHGFGISNPNFVGPVTVQVVKPWYKGSFIDLPTEKNVYPGGRWLRLLMQTGSGKKSSSDEPWTFLLEGRVTREIQRLIAELQKQGQLRVELLGPVADSSSGDLYEA